MARPRPEHAGFELEVREAEQSFAWSTKKVNDLIVAMEDGYKPKMNPFHGGNLNLRKGNIVFEYTQHELMEIKRCATDIIYFANNYCTVMTDDGLQTIQLRGYQEEMLKQFQAERFNVCLASRQVGKCLLFDTEILLMRDGKGLKTTIGRLYFESIKLQRPLTLFEKVKYNLWKLYDLIGSFDRKQG